VGERTEQVRRGETQRRAGGLTVGEVLRFDLLRSAVVLAGQAGIGRPVERLNVMTVPEILPWAKPHEFMLTTGYPLPRSAGQLAGLVRSFADRDLAAFGIKFGAHLRELPAEMLRAADEVQLPVIQIPEDVAFDDILSVVLSEIVNRQAMAISRAQQIHDSFLDIVLGGVPAACGRPANPLDARTCGDLTHTVSLPAGPAAG
jgi:PucR family transcriptional regulator, purine catabolism regulatory protein